MLVNFEANTYVLVVKYLTYLEQNNAIFKKKIFYFRNLYIPMTTFFFITFIKKTVLNNIKQKSKNITKTQYSKKIIKINDEFDHIL